MKKFLSFITVVSLLFSTVLLDSVYCQMPPRDLSVALPKNLAELKRIRILVESEKSKIQMSISAAFEVFDDKGGLVTRGSKLDGATVRPVSQGMQWWNKIVQTRFLVVRSFDNGIRIGSSGVYRDEILIYKNADGKLDVVNRLGLDDYLKGVLPFEGNPEWTIETLKAQAVASRTFALTRMIDRQNKEYDVTSGVTSQVYAGKQIENKRTTQAIDETRGEVLMHGNKLFPAYFHSTCGGATEAADSVWNVKKHPSLTRVECSYCRRSPHYQWEATVTAAEIKDALAKQNTPVAEVIDIRAEKKDKDGRAHEIIIKSSYIEKRVDAADFRVWVDPMRIKSNRFTKIFKNANGDFVFKGKGWGHGVGMCQYGMKYLGELGYNYKDILEYYYPSSNVVKLKEFMD